MTALQSAMQRLSNLRLSLLYNTSHRLSTTTNLNTKTTVDKAKDLKPPKKPSTAFFRFIKQERSNILQTNPLISQKDVVKIAAEQWKNANETTKNKFQEEYKQAYAEYQQEFQRYSNSLTTSDKIEILESKLSAKIDKEKKLLKKQKLESGKPKKPRSAYFFFVDAKTPERPADMLYKDWVLKVSKMWQEASQEEKTKYTEIYQKANEAYQEKLAAWEKENQKKGPKDVVGH